MLRSSKPVVRGIAKSRKGSLPISVEALIKRTKSAAFFAEVYKLAGEEHRVSRTQAREAKKVLAKSPRQRAQKHIERGIIPAILAPGIQAVGRAAKAAIDAKQGRWSAAGRALKDTTRGGVAQAAIQGGMVGAGLSLGHGGLQVARAKDTYEDFLSQRRKS